jgi:sulfatase modifying factor 1
MRSLRQPLLSLVALLLLAPAARAGGPRSKSGMVRMPAGAYRSLYDRRRPVTDVSWHAARAYCESLGKRLPTTHEWEYAAVASETRADATSDPAFVQRLVTLYASRPRPLPPVGSGFRTVHGVRDLHGRAWEWVEDFDSTHRARHSHGVAAREHDASCAGAAVGALDPANYAGFLRLAFRAGLTGRSTLGTLGFRCAA